MAGQISDTQQRLLQLAKALAGSTAPLRVNEVAQRFEVSPPLALRDLENLAAAGMSRRNSAGLWERGEYWEALAKTLVAQELTKLLNSLNQDSQD